MDVPSIRGENRYRTELQVMSAEISPRCKKQKGTSFSRFLFCSPNDFIIEPFESENQADK